MFVVRSAPFRFIRSSLGYRFGAFSLQTPSSGGIVVQVVCLLYMSRFVIVRVVLFVEIMIFVGNSPVCSDFLVVE